MTESSPWLSRTMALSLVVALWAAIYLPRLGYLETQGEEGRRILPALHMLEGGNWFVPQVSGQDYYNKPPGINWLVAGSVRLVGQYSDAAARLPSVLAILAMVVLLVSLKGPWLDLKARVAAAAIFLTNAGLMEKGRLIEMEAVYVSLCGMAILWWLDRWSGGASRWKLWLVPALLLSAGALVKGPILGIVFYIMVLAVLFYAKRLRELFTLPHLCAMVIILSLCLGWVAVAWLNTNPDAMTHQWRGQILPRLTPAAFTFADWATRAGSALIDFLPWLLFVPLLWVPRLTRNIDPTHWPLFRGARLGLAVAFLALELMPGTMPRYTMPVYGLASVLLGWLLAAHVQAMASDKVWKTILVGGYIAMAIVPLVGLALFLTMPHVQHLPKSLEWLAVFRTSPSAPDGSAVPLSPMLFIGTFTWAMTGLTIIVCSIALRHRQYFAGGFGLTMATAVLCALGMFQYFAFGMPLRKANPKLHNRAAAVDAKVPAWSTLYAFRVDYEPMMLYIRHKPVYLIQPQQLDSRVSYLLVPARQLKEPEVQTALGQSWRELLALDHKPTKGKLLLLERAEAATTQSSTTTAPKR